MKSEQVLRVLLTFGGKPQQISEGKEERFLENLEPIHLTFNLSLAGGKQQRIFDCSFQKDGRGTLFAFPHSTGGNKRLLIHFHCLQSSHGRQCFFFLRQPEELEADEQETLALLRSLHAEVEQAYELVQQFAHMVRTRTGEQLDEWLSCVKASRIRELQGFVAGVIRDKEAVKASLTLSASSWSSFTPKAEYSTPCREPERIAPNLITDGLTEVIPPFGYAPLA